MKMTCTDGMMMHAPTLQDPISPGGKGIARLFIIL